MSSTTTESPEVPAKHSAHRSNTRYCAECICTMDAGRESRTRATSSSHKDWQLRHLGGTLCMSYTLATSYQINKLLRVLRPHCSLRPSMQQFSPPPCQQSVPSFILTSVPLGLVERICWATRLPHPSGRSCQISRAESLSFDPSWPCNSSPLFCAPPRQA